MINQAGIISTIAGGGPIGVDGDGGPATAADLGAIGLGLTVDEAGNLYFESGSSLRKVAPTGILSTVGPPEFSNSLRGGFAVGHDGSIYFCEGVFLRKLSPAGTESTIAGVTTTMPEDSGDGGPAVKAGLFSCMDVALTSSGSILIADGSNRIRIWCGRNRADRPYSARAASRYRRLYQGDP
jgi:hypothetical protein